MSRKKRGLRTPERPPEYGFPLENLRGNWLDVIFERLTGKPGPRGGQKQKVEALRELLQDGDRWDERLAELPVLSLIALEILVEARGGLPVEDLEDLLQRCTDCDEDAAFIAREQLAERLLVVPLGDNNTGEAEALSLYEGTLPVLDDRIRGVSLPALPAELASANDDGTSDARLCRTLAIAGLTAHRRLRFTQAGAPDRTALKRFAKNLGAPQDEVFELAEHAMHRGLVRAYGENLSPDPDRMLGAARGRTENGSASWFEPWLEPGRWVSLEALVRASVRALLATGPTSEPEHDSANVVLGTPPLFDYFDQRLRAAEGLEHRTVEGVDWLRHPAAPAALSGDGHVTASFEVMLGPAAHPEVVACVALGCELQRIDRVLTFHITPESVAQGKAAGLAVGQLRRALDVVGRHPLAENVAQLVAEWEEACTVARVSKGWFLFVSPELQPALEKGDLSPYLIGSPMPGVLELDPRAPRNEIEAALTEHRVRLSLNFPAPDAGARHEPGLRAGRNPLDLDDPWDNEVREPSLAGAPRPWSLEPGGAPALRERLALARATGFADDLPSDDLETALAEALPGEIAERLATLRQDLAPLQRDAARELARFHRKLSGADCARFELARADGAPLLSFLVLKPKWRRRIVHTAANLEELLDFAEEAADRGRCTPAGKRLLAQLDGLMLANSAEAIPDFAASIARLAALGPEANRDLEPPNPSAGLQPAGASKRPTTGKGTRRRRGPAIVVEFDNEVPAPSLPAIESFPEIEQNELLSRLSDAVKHRRSACLLVSSDAGPEVLALGLDRIELRGNRQVLLAEDLHSGEGRVVHVRKIRSILL